MRIGIDARVLESKGNGIRTYAEDLLNTLPGIDDENEYILYVEGKGKLPKNMSNKCKVASSPLFAKKGVWQLYLTKMLIKDKIDVFHSPWFILPIKYKLAKRPYFITTCHSLLTFKFDKPTVIQKLVSGISGGITAYSADKIIAVSNTLKQEIIDTYKLPESKIAVTYVGVPKFFKPLHDEEMLEEIRSKFNIGEVDIIFSVGGNAPRKNIFTLLKAFIELKKSYGFKGKLVITRFEPNIDLLKNEVIPLKWVNREELVCLYNLSLFTVYPSLNEGIGLPVIESMACGKPVIVTANTAMSEVMGDAGLVIYDPMNPHKWAEAMYMLASDSYLRKRLGEKGLKRSANFTLEKVALRTLKVYRECILG
jgi:glycosyltransferase involved in cell wall biosynthesis